MNLPIGRRGDPFIVMVGTSPTVTGEIFIRPGANADIPALLDIWVEAWTRSMPEIDFEARRPWKAERLRTMIAEGAALTLALRHDRIIGGTLVNIEGSCLDQLVVTPAEWGHGVASALVANARTLCPAGLSLTVNQANPRAIRFYEREGFVKTGEGVNPNSGLPILVYQWTPSAAGAASSPN
jgi:putative acetyltransferase